MFQHLRFGDRSVRREFGLTFVTALMFVESTSSTLTGGVRAQPPQSERKLSIVSLRCASARREAGNQPGIEQLGKDLKGNTPLVEV